MFSILIFIILKKKYLSFIFNKIDQCLISEKVFIYLLIYSGNISYSLFLLLSAILVKNLNIYRVCIYKWLINKIPLILSKDATGIFSLLSIHERTSVFLISHSLFPSWTSSFRVYGWLNAQLCNATQIYWPRARFPFRRSSSPKTDRSRSALDSTFRLSLNSYPGHLTEIFIEGLRRGPLVALLLRARQNDDKARRGSS